jgi:hypothetical protein|tara:strand:- start:840 stop:1367 length:528 start_codon:yes stop_codon:yes gene_type:complete
MKITAKHYFFSFLISLFLILNSCGIYKKTDARKVSTVGTERAKQNVKEGRGVSIAGIGKGLKSTSYEFASSNPMWRASLETLDFLPLSTIDYAGGVIVSDWYQDNSASATALKITVRFLSNEIAATNLKIIVHERKCNKNQVCTTTLLKQSKIKEELVSSIVRRAAVLEKEKPKK